MPGSLAWRANGAALAVVVAAAFAPHAAAATSTSSLSNAVAAAHDFTTFESDLLPRWVDSFRVNATAGAFTWSPAHNQTSLYGATDLVYLLFSVGRLEDAVAAPGARDAWCNAINAFQDATTGYFWPLEWEDQNKANWPWHPTHAAAETLALLNCSVRYDMAAIDALLRNESSWRPFLNEWITNSTNIWSGSQQAQSLPGIMRSAFPERQYAFYDFFLSFLGNASDPRTGYFPGKTSDDVDALGGAFHFYKVHNCLAPGAAWPHHAKVVDATLATQDPANGMWRPGHPGPAAFGLSYCIDLDGVHALARSAQLAASAAADMSHVDHHAAAATADLGSRGRRGGSRTAQGRRAPVPYRWGDVEAACDRYLRTAAEQLGNAANVVEVGGGYAANTHLMHGATFAVAECQTWFPHLVNTSRPWRRVVAGAAGVTHTLVERSCAYA